MFDNIGEKLNTFAEVIGMFDNIGKKIKTLAQVICWIGIIFAVICGFLIMKAGGSAIFSGFIIMIIGSLISWFSSFTLYGFGEIIDQLKYSNEWLEKRAPRQGKTAEPKHIGWICKKCNTENNRNAQFCKDCGTYK